MPTPPGPTSDPASGAPSTPDWTPPGQESAAADAETLESASDSLARASEAVAQAREDLAEASSGGGSEQDAAVQQAEEALEAAEEALADAAERLSDAASGSADPEAMNEAVQAAEEALAAAEEALASASQAASGSEDELADAAGGAEPEEELLGAEETPAGGGGMSGSPALAGSASAAAGAAGGASGTAADQQAAEGGQPRVVVAVAGAESALESAQGAVAEAVRALIITGVYLPPGGSADGSDGLPQGGVIVLVPGTSDGTSDVAALENELEGALVVFDGRLLEERNRLASQRRGGGIADVDDGGAESDPGAEAAALLESLGEPGAAGEAAEAIADAKTGTNSGDDFPVDDPGAGKRESNTVRPGDIPEGVPDGADDDIVARQIREAAMNETDPVLREKLWREYINYKKGGG